MMYLQKVDVEFEELNLAAEQFESESELTIDSYKSFMTDTCPKLIRTYSIIDLNLYPVDSIEISKNYEAILHNTITLFRKIVAFTERSEQKLISLLTSKTMLLEQRQVDSLKKYLKIEMSSPREALDLTEYLVKNKDNQKTAASGRMFMEEYSANLLVGHHKDFLTSLEKILANVSDYNIIESSENPARRISNLSPTQLGLFSSLLVESNDIKRGFRNLNKQELDKVFSEYLVFNDRPVSASTLKSKGYFGKQTEPSDVDALEDFLNHLLNKLRKERKKI